MFRLQQDESSGQFSTGSDVTFCWLILTQEFEVPQYSLYVTLFLGLADRGDAFTMFNSAVFFSLMQKVVEKDPCIPK